MGYTDDARALPALPSAKPSVRVALTRRNAGASDYIPREPAPYSVGLRCVCSYVCLRTYVERTSWLAVCVPRFGSTGRGNKIYSMPRLLFRHRYLATLET